MRPDRFERLLADAINRDGRLAARTYSEVGFTRSAYGIVATTPAGTPVNVQIVGRLADGERNDQPAAPVLGTPHSDLVIPDPVEGGKLDLAVLEQYVAGLVVAAVPAEIAEVGLYQNRPTPGAVHYGLTVTYYSGAATFVYVLSAGASRHADFEPPALVGA